MLERTIEIGQHYPRFTAHCGLGRIIMVSSFGLGAIWEGELLDSKLNGVGRYLRVLKDGSVC